MKIGTMSVLVEFLDVKSKMKLNLLCRHVYRVVMPGTSGRFLIGVSREFPDWLEWGKNDAALSEIKLQKGLSIKIGSDEGTYYGEMQEKGKKLTI